MATIKARLAGLRRGTAAQWSLANPVLLDGEPGYETDTKRLRIGDGVTQFTSLPYVKMSATDAQAASALLAAFAALGAAADKLGYFSGPAAMAVTDLTAYGRQLIGAADINAARTVLGIGSIASLSTINFANMAAGAYVLAAAGIAANKTVDNKFPTVKAVAEYVESYNPVKMWVNFDGTPKSGTYTRAGNVVTVTMAGHGMTTGQYAWNDYTSGTATDGWFQVTVIDPNTYTVTDDNSGATSGNVTRQVWMRAGFNVASIRRTPSGFSTGDYTIAFTTAMPDTGYSLGGVGSDNTPDTTFRSINAGPVSSQLTTSCRILHKGVNASNQAIEDSAMICAQAYR